MADTIIKTGLGLVDFTVVPHWGNEKYTDRLEQIKSGLESDGFAVRTLEDGETLQVEV